MSDAIGLAYTIGLWTTIIYAIWSHRHDKTRDGADNYIILSVVWPLLWMYKIFKWMFVWRRRGSCDNFENMDIERKQ